MPKFRKKPTVVDAEQWFPGKPVRGVEEVIFKIDDETYPSGYGYVTTIHGQATTVSPGDWIIQEPDGIHYYPCKPEIFEATYELVELTDLIESKENP